MMNLVPYDWEAASADPEWRSKIAFPISQSEIDELCADQLKQVLIEIGKIEDTVQRDAALLCTHGLLSAARAVSIAASCADVARAQSIRLVAGRPDAQYILGALPANQFVPPTSLTQRPTAPPLASLRAALRTASWTPWWRLGAAVLAPDVIAVTHNSLLVDAARRGGQRIRFCHSEGYFQNGFDHDRQSVDTAATTERLVAAMLDGLVAGAETFDRATIYLQQAVRSALMVAIESLSLLQSVSVLPPVLWSGTGGKYWGRALGIVIMRRGGNVIRFDHGGTTGLVAAIDAMILRELAVSTSFVVATDAAAQSIRTALDASSIKSAAGHVNIVGHSGDPHFAVTCQQQAKVRSARPKVLYAPSALLGFRQVVPPTLPDLIYLDWQCRVVEALKKQPLDILCRPHPEGLFGGQIHPLAALIETQDRSFEELLSEADVLLVDCPLSTTFGLALCTDKPVVYLNIGVGQFEPNITTAIAERCRIVDCQPDDRNRPILDESELADAIFSRNPVDPMVFRRLFCG